MEFAKQAMHSVRLDSTDSSEDMPKPKPGSRLIKDAIPRMRGVSNKAATGATRTLHWIWHRIGYTTFRILSTLNLFLAVFVGIFAQILAYYYNGALNIQPFIATLLYAPALAAMAVLRENAVVSGTSASGVGVARSRATLFSYLALLISAVLSIVQPVTERWADSGISGTSMWTALGGSFLFFYALLISEVLFAAAINLKNVSYTAKDDGTRDVGADIESASHIGGYTPID